LMVTLLLDGNLKPEFRIAALTRSRDS